MVRAVVCIGAISVVKQIMVVFMVVQLNQNMLGSSVKKGPKWKVCI